MVEEWKIDDNQYKEGKEEFSQKEGLRMLRTGVGAWLKEPAGEDV